MTISGPVKLTLLLASTLALSACTSSGGGEPEEDVVLSDFSSEQELSTLPDRTILQTNDGVKSIRYGFTGRVPDNIGANTSQLRPRRFRTTETPGVYDIRFSVRGNAPYYTAYGVDLTTGGVVSASLTTPDGPVGVEFEAIDGLGLKYTEAGVWKVLPKNNGSVTVKGGYATGFTTRSVPRTGTATFNGSMLGRYVSKADDVISGATGDVNLTATFTGGGSISGSITNVTLTDGIVSGTALNDFNVLINGLDADGSFEEGGGIIAQAAPGNPTDFTGGTTGPVSGHFFGPDAEEVGMQFRVKEDAGGDTVRALTGAIAAKR